jgi:putative membrane protein
MHQLAGTLFGRWYVTLFGLTFAWRATRHLGWRRTLLYAALATAVGVAAENGSVHIGFPYTHYSFNPALRHKELFVGDVPLMVPLSYTFMGYFAFASGRLLASGPRRTRAPRPWMEVTLAWVLAVWALWVLDPVSRLGQRFYLGRLFSYRGPGFWFGLPLGSQVGFAATAAVLLGLLAVLARRDADVAVPGLVHHPHSLALLTYHLQVGHLAVVALVIGAGNLAGVALVMWAPAAAMTAVHWASLGRQRGGASTARALPIPRAEQGALAEQGAQTERDGPVAVGGDRGSRVEAATRR